MDNIKYRLEKIKKLDSKIRELETNSAILCKIATLKAKEEKCTSVLSNEPRGNGLRDKTDITIKRIEVESKYNKNVQNEKNKLIRMIDEYTNIIDTLPDEHADIRQILKEYYILNKGWRGVAKSVSYSQTQTRRLAKKGIDMLSERWHK